jgi:hypothetical protein
MKLEFHQNWSWEWQVLHTSPNNIAVNEGSATANECSQCKAAYANKQVFNVCVTVRLNKSHTSMLNLISPCRTSRSIHLFGCFVQLLVLSQLNCQFQCPTLGFGQVGPD